MIEFLEIFNIPETYRVKIQQMVWEKEKFDRFE
jgi:hypothetical protein